MGRVSALGFFEELRFIIELLAACHLFAATLGKKREHFIQKVVFGSVALGALACVYPFLANYFPSVDRAVLVSAINVSWYVMLTLGTAIVIRWCYQLTVADTLFLVVAGYSLQHIEYVAVNEVLAIGIWSRLQEMIGLYFVICLATAIPLYYVVWRIFHRHLEVQGGKIFEDTPDRIALTLLMCILLFLCTFMCQTIFTSGRFDHNQINYLGAATDFFICVLILWVQYAICTIHNLNREKDIVEQLLYERKRQYELSRENIEIINRKCHDLKHQIRALKQVDSSQRNDYIEELEQNIDIYDAVVETGNEVVNTILSEKILNCEGRHIRLSCIVDASHLDFMSTLDIYALLGNALDNAIENVSRYKDEDKRVISLTIEAVGDFLSIQTNNYCEEKVQFVDGLPLTTKRNQAYHGFGIKSMRHLAEKYGGYLVTSLENQVFTLQILLPMPPEFLRLYAMGQK